MPQSRINFALLTQFFEEQPDRVFTLPELECLSVEKHGDWNLPPSMMSHAFVQMLLSRTNLCVIRVRSPHYSSLRRFSWHGKASSMAMAISIKKETAFFSHGSALWIHRLSDSHKHIFINKEQSQKPKNSGHLSQEAIDRAFRNQQRRSQLTYKYQDATITLLSGKHTGRLEVQSAEAPSGHRVEVTSLERTLVDITVRPAYSGGVSSVLQAFRLARERTSIIKMMSLLDRFDYTYPYHQSIGLYLQHAGYPEADQMLARANGVKFDFYLCHALRNPRYDANWKVFFPRNLK